jgi:GAF domain-containing protein
MARGRETTGDFARDVQRLTDPDERLQRGVELVVELVDGCDHAGVTIVSRNGVTTAAASDDLVLRGDELQYGLGEGPCLDAVRAQRTVISQDLTVDHRWPRWAPQVVSTLGVRAMMSLLLYTQQDSLGHAPSTCTDTGRRRGTTTTSPSRTPWPVIWRSLWPTPGRSSTGAGRWSTARRSDRPKAS